MDIMFEIVSRQKFSANFPVSHVFGEAGGYIGRSEECEWVLPDRSREISRQHALITFEDGHFYLEDVSANGVFLSLAHEPVGKDSRHRIEHGEGFIIGAYTIMARLLHNPGAYAGSPEDVEDILSRPKGLSLNPLTAMEQEEELVARKRMGEYDDLLSGRQTRAVLPADHTDPLLGRLQPIVAVPEQEELIPENWDAEPDNDDESGEACPLGGETAAGAPQADSETQAAAAPQTAPESRSVPVPETDVFFKALGFAEPPSSPKERERVLKLAAELLAAAVDGMTSALHNRAECKNELRLPATSTGLAVNNNPLKFSPSPEAALATLLGPPQKGVMPSVKAMTNGFNDLHRHHMGLLAGAPARRCWTKFRPVPWKTAWTSTARCAWAGPRASGRPSSACTALCATIMKVWKPCSCRISPAPTKCRAGPSTRWARVPSKEHNNEKIRTVVDGTDGDLRTDGLLRRARPTAGSQPGQCESGFFGPPFAGGGQGL